MQQVTVAVNVLEHLDIPIGDTLWGSRDLPVTSGKARSRVDNWRKQAIVLIENQPIRINE